MKKGLIILLLILILTGCNTPIKANEGQITLFLEEEYHQYMKYDQIPAFTFTFEGVINTADVDTIKSYQVVFRENDDLLLSKIITNLFTEYQGRVEIEVIEVVDSKNARINKIEDGKITLLNITPDDNKEYLEVAYFELENGLKLTLEYRRFKYEGVNYYVWPKKRNMMMWLYYPFMVIEQNNQKEILLITLPNRITFVIGPQLKATNIISNNQYLNDRHEYYSFTYLDEYDNFEDKKQHVVNYYINNYQGYFEDELLYFTYLKVKFVITFNENNFRIEFVEKV